MRNANCFLALMRCRLTSVLNCFKAKFSPLLIASLATVTLSACSFSYPDIEVDRPAAIFYLDAPASASANATFSVAVYYANTSGTPTTWALLDTFKWEIASSSVLTVSGSGRALRQDPRDNTPRTQAFSTTVGSRSLPLSLPEGTYSLQMAPANFAANLTSWYPGYPPSMATRSLVVN